MFTYAEITLIAFENVCMQFPLLLNIIENPSFTFCKKFKKY